MRIVTRADLDGVVCAVLLREVHGKNTAIFWVEPGEMQKGYIQIQKGDIIANLPFNENCSLWFDHHVTNEVPSEKFEGRFEIAPSAAGIIADYYKGKISTKFSELLHQTDRIDSANLTLEEVKKPETNPYLLLSMTLSSRHSEDFPYWNHVVKLLQKLPIEKILNDPDVKKRCNQVIEQNILYKNLLLENTEEFDNVTITDFRNYKTAPRGNRFLVYSLFPNTNVNIKISPHNEDDKRWIISVGRSIFNKTCNVNIGKMLANFEGGGHKGAGSCNFDKSKFDDYFHKIKEILLANE
jgi:oligoribonuclease NrnB/cAMP/cGMP phosphodiesterase (DHH superfamily)